MKPDSVIDLDDYDDIQEIPKGCNSEDYRLERRWKRHELSSSNKQLKHDHSGRGRRSTVKSRGNVASFTVKKGHLSQISEDEVDEDYKLFLDTYDPDIDVVSDDNADGSDNDANIGHNSNHNDHPYTEEESLHNNPKLDKGSKQRYETGNQRNKGSDSVGKKTSGSMKPQKNLEAKRGLCKKRLHDDVSFDKVSKQRVETGNQRKKGNDSVGKQTSGSIKSQWNSEAKRGLGKKRPCEDVSGVPNSNCHGNTELDDMDEDYQIYLNSCSWDDYVPSELIGKRSSVMQNSQVSDYALSEVDDDYLQYLNSIMIVDGEVECMPEMNTANMPESNTSNMPMRNTSMTDNVDGDSNSSECDVIILEPDQIHGNTPFVSAKTYDPSWFITEKNPQNNWQLSAYDNSQLKFRSRLMDDLQRPYNQEEFDELLLEVHQRKQKERHRESRNGVVKSCRTRGFNKSYLDLHPDLAKAIAEFKKPEKVLFLLRGFSFWLQNTAHDGTFRPWLDRDCLEFLQKM